MKLTTSISAEKLNALKAYAMNNAKRLIKVYDTEDDNLFVRRLEKGWSKRSEFARFLDSNFSDYKSQSEARGLTDFFRLKITNHYTKSGEILTVNQLTLDDIEEYELDGFNPDVLLYAIQKRNSSL
jgi:hypothetical protein